MRIIVGPLAKSGLESRVGPNLPAAINAALVYYVGKLNSGRRPIEFPKFLAMQEEGGGAGRRSPDDPPLTDLRPEIEVEVDERIEAALFTDAKKQGVSPTDLAGHAVLVYLAELDLIGEPYPAQSPRVPALAAPGHNPGTAAN
jgi:hypothetical protein